MDENRITELWNKAVAEIGDCSYPKIITRFAELVAADERERLAKAFDRQDVQFYGSAIAESLRRSNVQVQRDFGSIIAGGSAGTPGSAANGTEKGAT